MHRYRDPNTIYSPQDAISKVEVIYNDDEISIAKIKWYDQVVIGIRWNISLREWDDIEKKNGKRECVGMPVSRGYPTWFILPKEILDDKSKMFKALKSIKLNSI